ncbi:hypothetical protein Poli38472_006254 [Pythium oligandrum]|uniref:Uncharacterized protein n=1 Tax=Pythium oligandrum TaxID=41045 RepID=A0A8K1CUB4_PYTOL|nr:hypothetical protein Poli38472_006254 [Pythium oligandrum]|eukprot:TMW68786.1 hypothetical protein Poli38472_006254 [Pythium oligandrum]
MAASVAPMREEAAPSATTAAQPPMEEQASGSAGPCAKTTDNTPVVAQEATPVTGAHVNVVGGIQSGAPDQVVVDVEEQQEPAKASKHGRRPKRRNHMLPAPKKKKKVKKAPAHPCVGLYVDALDRNYLWAEAKIVDCDVVTQRIRVSFIGFGKNWDFWTDQLSVQPHGTIVRECFLDLRIESGQFDTHRAVLVFVALSRGRNAKSWDGQRGLFTDDPPELIEPITSPPDGTDVEVQTTKAKSTKPAKPKTPGTRQVPVSTSSSKPSSIDTVVNSGQDTRGKQRGGKTRQPLVVDPARTRKRRVDQDESPLAAMSSTSASQWSEAMMHAKRIQNEQEIIQNVAFLQKCAEIWQRQLAGLSIQLPSPATE